ncbi:MAG: membrane integrity-associated transporter subunit PqiC [Burkholderiales bacterium]|nr:membrane integrity-associated transporter subunit PqiC [Burkholderiales bacterium]
MRRRGFLGLALASAAAGCSFGRNGATDTATYDFGIELPSAHAPRSGRDLTLDEMSAAAWLQTPAILYRLMYRDPARLHAYALSRWTAAPADLIAQRVRLVLSSAPQRGLGRVSQGVGGARVLKLELDAFEQIVESPSASRAVVRMRAGLADSADRSLRAQRLFGVEAPCPSVDAPGAVYALRAATDTLIAQLLAWVDAGLSS